MKINFKRRQAVMGRSMKLGHCVCNPKNPCPCPIFKEHNVCPCAGEKLPVQGGEQALTKLVRKAGCASKIGQADLLRIIGELPPVEDPNIIVGVAAGDDAGIYRLNDQACLVQTVDVFSPCVDDAYLFGQIAAANSLSDVYAMGGRPLTALSIVGFPIDELDGKLMSEILRGGMDKLAEASCSLLGGHSINDEEIKCGFAITGLIESAKTIERAGAKPGDALVLTKPLGTGMVCFAAQLGRLSPEALAQVGGSMAQLNKDAAELMVKYQAHACTDITGFGLAGHLVEMARSSGVIVEIELERLPVFAAAVACLEQEILSGAIEGNQEYALSWVRVTESEVNGLLPIIYDPQTSGGLLISLPAERADSLVEDLTARGVEGAAVIGCVKESESSEATCAIVVQGRSLQNIIGEKEGSIMSIEDKDATGAEPASPEPPANAESEPCCCPPPSSSSEEEETDGEELELFTDFMRAVSRKGLIDLRNKKLMAIALSVAVRCKPCLLLQMRSACEMGISQAEMDEAANLAISFSGCPGMMFYSETVRELDCCSPNA